MCRRHVRHLRATDLIDLCPPIWYRDREAASIVWDLRVKGEDAHLGSSNELAGSFNEEELDA